MAQETKFNYRDFVSPNDFVSAFWIAANYILIAGTAFACIYFDHLFWYLYFPAVFFIATRQNALQDALGHDSTHYNLFKRKRWNVYGEFFYFVPMFDEFHRYRKDHAIHHKEVWAEEDPARLAFERWGLLKPNVNWFYAWFIKPFLLLDFVYFWRETFTDLLEDPRYRIRILGFWLPIIAASIVFGFWDWLLLYWFVPMLWLKPAVEFWTEVNDHFNVQVGDTRDSRGLFYSLILRSHNDGYHALHHRYPKIPWYNLKKAHKVWSKDRDIEKSHGFFETYRAVKP